MIGMKRCQKVTRKPKSPNDLNQRSYTQKIDDSGYKEEL